MTAEDITQVQTITVEFFSLIIFKCVPRRPLHHTQWRRGTAVISRGITCGRWNVKNFGIQVKEDRYRLTERIIAQQKTNPAGMLVRNQEVTVEEIQELKPVFGNTLKHVDSCFYSGSAQQSFNSRPVSCHDLPQSLPSVALPASVLSPTRKHGFIYIIAFYNQQTHTVHDFKTSQQEYLLNCLGIVSSILLFKRRSKSNHLS